MTEDAGNAQERYLRALDQVTAVAEGTSPASWEARSPCPDWTARHVLGHLIDAQRQTVALITGHGHRPPVTETVGLARLVRDDPVRAWAEARAVTGAMLSAVDPGAGVSTPLGKRTVGDVLDIALVEPLVHGWDLARATGQHVRLDPEAVQVVLSAVRVVGTQLAATGMYAAAVPTRPDAPAQDRLLAALGRRPDTSYPGDVVTAPSRGGAPAGTPGEPR